MDPRNALRGSCSYRVRVWRGARETVRKMLRYALPLGYRRLRPVRRPKLDAWVGTLDQILEDDKARGKKQRHTLPTGSSSGCATSISATVVIHQEVYLLTVLLDRGDPNSRNRE